MDRVNEYDNNCYCCPSAFSTRKIHGVRYEAMGNLNRFENFTEKANLYWGKGQISANEPVPPPALSRLKMPTNGDVPGTIKNGRTVNTIRTYA